MPNDKSTWLQHITSTICTAIVYIVLMCIVLCIIGLFVAKIIYHIYLNCLLILYAFSVKSWKTSDVRSISESYNTLCSWSIFGDTGNNVQIKYYDLNIVTEECNVTAHCLNENYINYKNGDNITFITSYIGFDCIYTGNVIDIYEIVFILFMLVFTFVVIIWIIYKSCSSNQYKIK